MSFQWVIDNATSMTIDRSPIVGQTITRNQTVRAVSRGSGIWRFTITVPNGFKFTDIRQKIVDLESLGRFSTQNVQISNSGLNYIVKYQGNSVNKTNFVASATAGNNYLTLTASPTTSSGYKFRKGDLIQLGTNPAVYTVTADVAYNANTVYVNRSIENTVTNITLKVGEDVVWTLICTEFPSWTISEYDLVQWSGPFVFYENRV